MRAGPGSSIRSRPRATGVAIARRDQSRIARDRSFISIARSRRSLTTGVAPSCTTFDRANTSPTRTFRCRVDAGQSHRGDRGVASHACARRALITVRRRRVYVRPSSSSATCTGISRCRSLAAAIRRLRTSLYAELPTALLSFQSFGRLVGSTTATQALYAVSYLAIRR